MCSELPQFQYQRVNKMACMMYTLQPADLSSFINYYSEMVLYYIVSRDQSVSAQTNSREDKWGELIVRSGVKTGWEQICSKKDFVGCQCLLWF